MFEAVNSPYVWHCYTLHEMKLLDKMGENPSFRGSEICIYHFSASQRALFSWCPDSLEPEDLEEGVVVPFFGMGTDTPGRWVFLSWC